MTDKNINNKIDNINLNSNDSVNSNIHVDSNDNIEFNNNPDNNIVTNSNSNIESNSSIESNSNININTNTNLLSPKIADSSNILNTSTDTKIYTPLLSPSSTTTKLPSTIKNSSELTSDISSSLIPSIIDTYLIKPPSWLSNLREEWVNEIGAMTESKKLWFFTQNQNNNIANNNSNTANSPLTSHNLSQSNFTSNIITSNNNMKTKPKLILPDDTLSNISSLSSQQFDINHDDALISPRSTSPSPINSFPNSPKLELDPTSKNISYSIAPKESAVSPTSGKYKAISTIFKTVSPNRKMGSKKIAIYDPSKSSSYSYFGGFFRAKTDSFIPDSQSYLLTLRTAISAQEDRMLLLQKDRKQIRSRMVKELDRWDKYALDSLSGLCRTLYETQLLQNTAAIELSNNIVGSLSFQLNQFQNILEKKLYKDGYLTLKPEEARLLISSTVISSDTVFLLEAENFPSYLIKNSNEVKELNESILSFNQIVTTISAQYHELQVSSLQIERKADRSKRYEDFFNQLTTLRDQKEEESHLKNSSSQDTAPSGLYYHPYDVENSVIFKRLLLDQRQWEGLSIQKFIQRLLEALSSLNISKDVNKINPPSIATIKTPTNSTMSTISSNSNPPELSKVSSIDTNRPSVIPSVKIIKNSSIHSFILALEDALRTKHQLNPNWCNTSAGYIGSCTLLCIERQIYPKLGELGIWPSRFITQHERTSDENFQNFHVPWLLCLKPSQLGIDDEFFAPFHQTTPIYSIETIFPNASDLISLIPHVLTSSYPSKFSNISDPSCPKCSDQFLPNCFMTGDTELPIQSSQSNRRYSFSNMDLQAVDSGWWIVRRSNENIDALDSKFPFIEAIKCLSKLNNICVPMDMLQCILETIRLISSEAKQNCIKFRRAKRLNEKLKSYSLSCCSKFCSSHHNEYLSLMCCTCMRDLDLTLDTSEEREIDTHSISIDADTLFPLVVFVVLHSKVPLYACFGLIERSIGSTNALHFGEIGLCVTLVEAALHHLAKLTPDQCNMPSYFPTLINSIDSIICKQDNTINSQLLHSSSPLPFSKELPSYALFIPFDMMPPLPDEIVLQENCVDPDLMSPDMRRRSVTIYVGLTKSVDKISNLSTVLEESLPSPKHNVSDSGKAKTNDSIEKALIDISEPTIVTNSIFNVTNSNILKESPYLQLNSLSLVPEIKNIMSVSNIIEINTESNYSCVPIDSSITNISVIAENDNHTMNDSKVDLNFALSPLKVDHEEFISPPTRRRSEAVHKTTAKKFIPIRKEPLPRINDSFNESLICDTPDIGNLSINTSFIFSPETQPNRLHASSPSPLDDDISLITPSVKYSYEPSSRAASASIATLKNSTSRNYNAFSVDALDKVGSIKNIKESSSFTSNNILDM